MPLSTLRKRLFGSEHIDVDPQSTDPDDITSNISGTANTSGSEPKTTDDMPRIETLAVSDPEKASPKVSVGPDNTNGQFGDDDPVLRDIPWHVRRVISLKDDPTEPTLTFRYFILTLLFVIPGAFLSQMSTYRTTYAPYSVFFVQIASNYSGIWLAKVLPSTIVRIPFTKYNFNTNPGPWSTKEHVLVTISAASGATYNLAFAPISLAELYFGITIHPAIAIFFMWSVVYTGYSFAALARQFLLYDPQYPW